MLKSIRDVSGQVVDYALVDEWYNKRDKLKKKKKLNKTKEEDIYIYPEKKEKMTEVAALAAYQKAIYDMMYIPQYITVTMDSVSDYKKIYETGLLFNGRWFKRISCYAYKA